MKGPWASHSPSQWPEIIQERARVRREAPAPRGIGASGGSGIGQSAGAANRRRTNVAGDGHRNIDDTRYVDAGHWKRSVC